MRAQWPAGEHRLEYSEGHSVRRQHKTLRRLAAVAVICAALAGQLAVGHFSNPRGVGGVQVATTGSVEPDGGTLGGPGVP